jgi:hypothetical protein
MLFYAIKITFPISLFFISQPCLLLFDEQQGKIQKIMSHRAIISLSIRPFECLAAQNTALFIPFYQHKSILQMNSMNEIQVNARGFL